MIADLNDLKQLSEERFGGTAEAEITRFRAVQIAEQAGGLAVRSWFVQQVVGDMVRELLPPSEIIQTINLGVQDEEGECRADFYNIEGPVLNFYKNLPLLNAHQLLAKPQRFYYEFTDATKKVGLRLVDGMDIWTNGSWGLAGQQDVIRAARDNIQQQEDAISLVIRPLADPQLNPELAAVGRQLLKRHPYA